MYNTSDLLLEWEDHTPISFDPDMRLTEFNLATFWHNTTVVHSDQINMRHGAFGKFNKLNFFIYLLNCKFLYF